jgi:hypothetical protein
MSEKIDTADSRDLALASSCLAVVEVQSCR